MSCGDGYAHASGYLRRREKDTANGAGEKSVWPVPDDSTHATWILDT